MKTNKKTPVDCSYCPPAFESIQIVESRIVCGSLGATTEEFEIDDEFTW